MDAQPARRPFETRDLAAEPDAIAPDGSAIRLLPTLDGGGMAHATLPPGAVSLAVRHRTVEEIWYVVRGRGQVWRKQGDREEVVDVHPGRSLTIPLGTHFQFRTTGDEPFCFIMSTTPPWLGPEEAVRVGDHWPVPDPRQDPPAAPPQGD